MSRNDLSKTPKTVKTVPVVKHLPVPARCSDRHLVRQVPDQKGSAYRQLQSRHKKRPSFSFSAKQLPAGGRQAPNLPRMRPYKRPARVEKRAKSPHSPARDSGSSVSLASKNQESVLNLRRLRRDGRRTPDQFKQTALAVGSPSQLSLRTISEHYNVPDAHFASPADVFRYRGYKKLGKIDEGAFGVVSKALRLADQSLVAVKEVDLRRKRAKRIEEMKRELFVLQKVDSANVVKLVEHFIIGQTLVIIMEFCAGSNLTSYLKETGIGELEATSLFRQMAAALKVLHRKGIAHRDVKLNNFLLDGSRALVKVGDFGLSVVAYRAGQGVLAAKTYCGTEPYMAPEILRRNSLGVRSYNPLYADVWSLGICLFAMLTRTFPFKMQTSQRGLFRAQVARRWRFPRRLRDTLSEEIKDLVWHMLDPEPERRITINGVLAHPWLNNNTVLLSYDDSSDSEVR